VVVDSKDDDDDHDTCGDKTVGMIGDDLDDVMVFDDMIVF